MEYLVPWDLLLEWGKKEINTNAGNDPFGSILWRARGAALGHPRLLPSSHSLESPGSTSPEGFGQEGTWLGLGFHCDH